MAQIGFWMQPLSIQRCMHLDVGMALLSLFAFVLGSALLWLVRACCMELCRSFDQLVYGLSVA
jgi:hypothetical protein